MLNNIATKKYETSSSVPFEITQCCTNGTSTLLKGEIKIRYNIHHIDHYEIEN